MTNGDLMNHLAGIRDLRNQLFKTPELAKLPARVFKSKIDDEGQVVTIFPTHAGYKKTEIDIFYAADGRIENGVYNGQQISDNESQLFADVYM